MYVHYIFVSNCIISGNSANLQKNKIKIIKTNEKIHQNEVFTAFTNVLFLFYFWSHMYTWVVLQGTHSYISQYGLFAFAMII